ncbi:MAG: alginate lyase family protein [Terriglobia bacterium]
MLTRSQWKRAKTRVAAMGREEIRTRLRQELAKRSDALIFGLGAGSVAAELRGPNGARNIRAALPASTTHIAAAPPGRFFFERGDLSQIKALLAGRFPNETASIIEQADRICRHEFDLLGYSRLFFGAGTNWRWDPVNRKQAPRKAWYKIHYLDFEEVGDHKVIWELNRHQHLVTLAKAWVLSEERKYATEILNQWQHWQRENRYPTGINWASSLEVAFRSLAWFWLGHLLASNAGAPARFQHDLLQGLALNARHIERYLSTYSSPNTHLLGEAVALFFTGVLCPQLRSAARWQELGWGIIIDQSEKQVRLDGWHFEQSAYYHVYALDFFLHARILAARNDIPIPDVFDSTIQRMLEALQTCSQAGLAPRFGDDDGGRVFDPRRNRAEHMLDPLSTGAILYGRPDFKAACGGLKEESVWLLGPEGARRFDEMDSAGFPPVSARLASSGLYVMASSGHALEGGPASTPLRYQMTIDAGPQGTGNSGHGHADALSVQLSAGGEPWLIDPGAYRYISPGNDRDFYRSTAAHSTMQVDGCSQAEPLHQFAWRALPVVRADQWVTSERFDLFSGHHDGYRRLPEPVTHRRWVFHLKPHFWLVRDLAEGEGEHDLEIFWHFSPALAPAYTPPGFTLTRASEYAANPKPSDPQGLTIFPVKCHGWTQEILRGRASPAYGVEGPAPVVRFATRKPMPADFTVLLQPAGSAPQWEASLTRIDAENPSKVQGYCYATAEAHHLFFFSDDGGKWGLDLWESDARFVYVGLRRRSETVHLALCDGSYANFDSKRVFTCTRSVERCELLPGRGGYEISCSEPAAAAEYEPASLNSLLDAMLVPK